VTQPDLRQPVYTRIIARDHHDIGAAEWIDPTIPGQVGCTLTLCGILVYEDDDFVGITCALTDMGPDTAPNARGMFTIPKTAIILRRDKPFVLTPDHANDDIPPTTDSADPELRTPRKRRKRTP